jgi:hypothetical protein
MSGVPELSHPWRGKLDEPGRALDRLDHAGAVPTGFEQSEYLVAAHPDGVDPTLVDDARGGFGRRSPGEHLALGRVPVKRVAQAQNPSASRDSASKPHGLGDDLGSTDVEVHPCPVDRAVLREQRRELLPGATGEPADVIHRRQRSNGAVGKLVVAVSKDRRGVPLNEVDDGIGASAEPQKWALRPDQRKLGRIGRRLVATKCGAGRTQLRFHHIHFVHRGIIAATRRGLHTIAPDDETQRLRGLAARHFSHNRVALDYARPRLAPRSGDSVNQQSRKDSG